MHTKLCSISLAVGPTTSAVVVVFIIQDPAFLLAAVDTLLACHNINDKTV
jgi:hypothetical protein